MNDSIRKHIRGRSGPAGSASKTPACVYMLADHLDAALAAGEDLLAVAKTWERGNPIDPGVAGMQRWTLSRVRAHEMQFLHRISRARERARELHGADAAFRPLVHLFVSGTEPLAVATAEYCDPSLAAFETGDAETAYLRSRGLIGEEAPGLEIDADLEIDEHFLIGGRARLGITMDLIAEFLDALDIKYDLYPPETAPVVDGPVVGGPVVGGPAASGDGAAAVPDMANATFTELLEAGMDDAALAAVTAAASAAGDGADRDKVAA